MVLAFCPARAWGVGSPGIQRLFSVITMILGITPWSPGLPVHERGGASFSTVARWMPARGGGTCLAPGMGMYSPTIVYQPGRGPSSKTVSDEDEALTIVRAVPAATPARSRSGLTGAVMITALGKHLQSLSAVDTSVLKLSPQLHQALKGLAPRAHRSLVPYVLLLTVIAVVSVLFADAPTREFVASHAHALLGR